MESFVSSLKTERPARKFYRTRDEVRAAVFDFIARFYNPKRRHSIIGYRSPVEFENAAVLAQQPVHRTGSSAVVIVSTWERICAQSQRPASVWHWFFARPGYRQLTVRSVVHAQN